jgi:hypothetical protein
MQWLWQQGLSTPPWLRLGARVFLATIRLEIGMCFLLVLPWLRDMKGLLYYCNQPGGNCCGGTT